MCIKAAKMKLEVFVYVSDWTLTQELVELWRGAYWDNDERAER